MAPDALSSYYHDLLEGSYDCVDRIVLNGYCSLCYSAGGFRCWWRRLHNGSEDELDNTHLMRMAGRFSRRVRGFAKANGIPVIDCNSEDKKHQIAEERLRNNPTVRGLFLILVSRAVATVWEVKRSHRGVIQNLVAKWPYINYYSFHIIDPEWGHITIKMAGHPPFGTQIILNGHEYVTCQARKTGIGFNKEGNCFTTISEPAALAKVADTLSDPRTVGRLRQVCERWIYTSCLCFGLDLEEQRQSGFGYQYSVYQVEYSRNLMFRIGGQMEQVFQGIIDRTRGQINLKRLRTIFGVKKRPHRNRKGKGPRLEAVIETPQYDLTVFKLHFGKLTLKIYTKGERVLRVEAIVHNTQELRCGRRLERFPKIVSRLRSMAEGFLNNLYCLDTAFISNEFLEQLPTPSRVGQTRVGGVDISKPRMWTVLSAVLGLACSPNGFTVSEFAAQVQSRNPQLRYGPRRAAYDLKKLRGKDLIQKKTGSRRYYTPAMGLRVMAALVILREKVLKPILAGAGKPKMGRKPKNWTQVDEHYELIRQNMFVLFQDLGIAA